MRAARAASGGGQGEPEGTFRAEPRGAGLLTLVSTCQRLNCKVKLMSAQQRRNGLWGNVTPTDSWTKLKVQKIWSVYTAVHLSPQYIRRKLGKGYRGFGRNSNSADRVQRSHSEPGGHT